MNEADNLGSVAVPPGEGGVSTAAVRAPYFGAGKALLVILIVFIAQAAVGFVFVIFNVVRALLSGTRPDDAAAIERAAAHMGGITVIVAVLVTGAVVFLLAVSWARRETWDRSDAGIGFRRASAASAAACAAMGALMAGTYLYGAHFFAPPHGARLGPLARLAFSRGFDRVAWVLVAIILAPAIEEFLFRGLLFQGFSRSWGRIGGGIAVTVLFVGAHAFEVRTYWPAAIAILALAVAALLARIRTGSLLPAACLHSAYNLAIVVYVGVRFWLPPLH